MPENNSMNLTKEEREYILQLIRWNLDSTNDCSKCGIDEWNRRNDSLKVNGITDETWSWDFDEDKEELEIMKNIWEKLK